MDEGGGGGLRSFISNGITRPYLDGLSVFQQLWLTFTCCARNVMFMLSSLSSLTCWTLAAVRSFSDCSSRIFTLSPNLITKDPEKKKTLTQNRASVKDRRSLLGKSNISCLYYGQVHVILQLRWEGCAIRRKFYSSSWWQNTLLCGFDSF